MPVFDQRMLKAPELYTPGKKPIGSVKVNENNEITKGLDISLLFTESFIENVIGTNSPVTLTSEGSPVKTSSIKGPCYQPSTSSGTTNTALTFDSQWFTAKGRSHIPPMTVMVEFYYDGGSVPDQLGLFQIGNFTGVDGVFLYINTDKKLYAASPSWVTSVSSSVLAAGWYRAIATYHWDSPDSTVHLWLDGSYVGSNVHSSAQPSNNTTAEIGRFANGQYGDSFPYPIADFFLWDRVLADAEIVALFKDPYQILDSI